MASLFPRWTNTAARATVFSIVALVVVVPLALMGWVRTPYATGEGSAPEQPVPFDHQLHAGAFGIDCRYCHAGAERSSTAGMPSTRTCIPCHNRVWLQSPAFAPVRGSIASGTPIVWRRVYDLPDYVFFNHAVHVNGGIGCESCHGRVDRMREVRQAVPLTMGWCLDCHRDPGPHLRPDSAITAMGWHPGARGGEENEDDAAARAFALRASARRLTDCTACHR